MRSSLRAWLRMRNSSRTWLRRENERFAATLPAGSKILDAGAGSQPYRLLFSHCDYEAADFEKIDKPYAKSTYVCDLAQIPVDDNTYDAIVFNQTMEHLPRPVTVLRELRRVLKPGGTMICTAPLFFEEHEQPYDFYRFTQFAWRHMLSEVDLRILRLDWMEGYMGTVAYQLKTAAKYLPFTPQDISPGWLGWLAFPVVIGSRFIFHITARLFYILDERGRYTKRGFPKNYVVIVQKPR